MFKPRGCLKSGCFGCLGIIILFLLIGGVTALLAWNDSKTNDPREESFTPLTAENNGILAGLPGRVVLDMSQGDFRIFPAQPGEGLRVEAQYDAQQYELNQEFTTNPDSSWLFVLDFHRTRTGMRAALQSIFSKGPGTRISVYLPPDVPVELVTNIAKGGVVMDLGGLWLTSAEIHFQQGGGELDFSEPLKEPISSLLINYDMGGGGFKKLGNASPSRLEVISSMGGGEVDLGGNWLNDCDVHLSVRLGGMSVVVPRGIKLIRSGEDSESLEMKDSEVHLPVLRLRSEVKYGHLEVVR